MAKLAKPLSNKALKALKTTSKNTVLYDRQGLQIVATIYGKKTWRFVYIFDGKKKTITLGNYPDISLALTRELAGQKWALLVQGIDPQEYTKQQRREQERERNITVKELAILWHTKRTVPQHRRKVLPKGNIMEAKERFIRLDELINKTDLRRSTIYRMMDNRLYHVKFKFR
ncbi:integrase arm-type DNA-binding domain-containing protein [Haemophilus parahaemolyticus]